MGMMKPNAIEPGDTVRASPVGAGSVTDITQAGYPQVNHIAVAWLIRTDGVVFDPYGHTRKPGFNEGDWHDYAAIQQRRQAA